MACVDPVVNESHETNNLLKLILKCYLSICFICHKLGSLNGWHQFKCFDAHFYVSILSAAATRLSLCIASLLKFSQVKNHAPVWFSFSASYSSDTHANIIFFSAVDISLCPCTFYEGIATNRACKTDIFHWIFIFSKLQPEVKTLLCAHINRGAPEDCVGSSTRDLPSAGYQ